MSKHVARYLMVVSVVSLLFLVSCQTTSPSKSTSGRKRKPTATAQDNNADLRRMLQRSRIFIAPKLVNQLDDPSDVNREMTVSMLGSMKDTRAVGKLISVLKTDKSSDVRAEAATSLGKIGDLKAIKPLVDGLDDKDYMVKRACEKALGKKLKSMAAVEPLLAVLKGRRSSSGYKRRASEVLEEITGQDYGKDADAWQQWWDFKRGVSTTAPPARKRPGRLAIGTPKRNIRTVKEKDYPRLAEDEIDIGFCALMIAKADYPSIDIEEYSARIDKLVAGLRPLVKRGMSGSETVSIINAYLFKKKGFKPQEGTKLLNLVLDRKRGDCSGLSVLYLAITDRLHLPFYGVAIPGHLFVRYDNGKERINIDPTLLGSSLSVAEYDQRFRKAKMARRRATYWTNYSKKETLGTVFLHRGTSRHRDRELRKAVSDYTMAISMNSTLQAAYNNRGVAQRWLNSHNDAILDFNRAIFMDPEDSSAYFNRGMCYTALLYHNKAMSDFSKVIKLVPKDHGAYWARGMANGCQHNFAAAISDFDKAIVLKPDYGEAYYDRGRVKGAAGDARGAKVDFRKAAQMGFDESDASWKLNPDAPPSTLVYVETVTSSPRDMSLTKSKRPSGTSSKLKSRSFRIKSQASGRTYGPFQFKNGTEVRIGKSVFSVVIVTSEKDVLRLRSAKNGRLYGPCRLLQGKSIMLGKSSFSMVL